MNTSHSSAERLEHWSALACVLIGIVLFYGPYLFRVDLFYDDVAHHIFWLYRYADPELFNGDISVPYFMTNAPWGYRALYSFVAPLVDVMQAAEWLAVLLFMVSAYLVARTAACAAEPGRQMYSLFAVAALVALLPLSVQQDFLPTIAFQRSFALPLLLLTIWALASRRFAWVGVSWLLAALIYPVVLPVQGLTAAAVFLLDLKRTGRMPAHWKLNGILGVVALAIAALGVPVPLEVGPAYTYEQAIQMPEFGPRGRLEMYQSGFIGNWLSGHRTGIGWTPGVLLLMGLGVAAEALRGGTRRIPPAVWILACVGMGLWSAMRLFPEELMFGLYLPNRHSRWAVGIFGIFAIAAGAVAALEYLGQGHDRAERKRDNRRRRAVACAVPLVVAMTLMPNAVGLWTRPVDTDLENVYSFIASLPKSTLVAAHPDLADFIPVRARRSVLASTETSMAWMQGYYAQVRPRVEASLRAAYATRIQDMDAVLQPYGVDVMLTGPPVWDKTGYFAPFDELVQTLRARGEQQGFVLQAPPADRVLFSSGAYFIVRVGACERLECA